MSVSATNRRTLRILASLALLFVVPFWALALLGIAPIEDIVPGHARHSWAFLAPDVWITWRAICILHASKISSVESNARLRDASLVLGGTFVPLGLYELAYGLGARVLLQPFRDVALEWLTLAFLLVAGPWLLVLGKSETPAERNLS